MYEFQARADICVGPCLVIFCARPSEPPVRPDWFQPCTPSAEEDWMIDKGDTAWVLTSTALVLLMTAPGLALFYGGMVRQRNVLATLLQSFAVLCIVSLQWVIFGYSLA